MAAWAEHDPGHCPGMKTCFLTHHASILVAIYQLMGSWRTLFSIIWPLVMAGEYFTLAIIFNHLLTRLVVRRICPGRLIHGWSVSVDEDKCSSQVVGLQGTLCGLQLLPYSLSYTSIMPKTQMETGLRWSWSSPPVWRGKWPSMYPRTCGWLHRSHPEPFHCSFESVNTARAGHLWATMDSK